MTSLDEIQVLIIDDNKQMRFLMRTLLRAAGIHQVVEAEEAKQAFECMTDTPIDLILVDWKMRPMDGISFTRHVRLSSESPNPCVPILMMTAHTEASRVAAARDAGVTGFLKKPISARTLFDRLSVALTDQRPFVKAPGFFGPDRRQRTILDYAGPMRRSTDRGANAMDAIDLDDDVRWRA